MPRWIKTAIMLVVFLAWGTYIGFAVFHGDQIPPPVWVVPAATWILLSSKITGITIGSGGIDVKTKEDKNDPHED